MNITDLEKTEFGSEIKDHEFLFNKKTVFVNNGSNGAVPKRVFDARQKLCLEIEQHPDNWFRENMKQYWKDAKAVVCKFLKVKDSNCLVFVPNATTGINTVLKSLRFDTGQMILGTSLTYGGVKNTMKYVSDTRNGVIAKFLDINLPISSSDQIVNMYKDFLVQHKNVKVAVLDYITSTSSILMPVKELIDVCHSHGVLTAIDGAHAPGQVDLNLDELGCDFFVGNLHKWMFVPRGCAILYTRKEHTNKVHSLSTSFNLYQGIDHEFRENGTQDHTPYFCAKYGLEFYQAIGGFEKIHTYNRKLAREARDYLVELWGATKQAIPADMESPYLLNIKLPPLKDFDGSEVGDNQMMPFLRLNHNITTMVDYYQDSNYLRVSCQIYNCMQDYITLGQIVKEFIK